LRLAWDSFRHEYRDGRAGGGAGSGSGSAVVTPDPDAGPGPDLGSGAGSSTDPWRTSDPWAKGSVRLPSKTPDPDPDPDPDPAPAYDPTSGATVGMPPECQELLAAMTKLANCPALAAAARQSLSQSIEMMRKQYSTIQLTPAMRQQVGAGCAQAVAALAHAVAANEATVPAGVLAALLPHTERVQRFAAVDGPSADGKLR